MRVASTNQQTNTGNSVQLDWIYSSLFTCCSETFRPVHLRGLLLAGLALAQVTPSGPTTPATPPNAASAQEPTHVPNARRQGTLRMLGFRNVTPMATYRSAVALGQATGQ